MKIIMNTAIIIWLFLNLSYTASLNKPYIDEEEIMWNEPRKLCGPGELLLMLLTICPDLPRNTINSIIGESKK